MPDTEGERTLFMRFTHALCSSLALLTFSFCLFAQAQSAPAVHLSNYDKVDPFIGTAGGGNTFPGATLPFGMMQWSPDTNHDAWYFYNDKQIQGFGLTHISGAGCPLYGDFAVLPMTSPLASSPGGDLAPYAADFSHDKEEAHPGYYAVTLANGIRVEITVSERAGIARFIFPAGTAARLLVNAGSSAGSFRSLDGKQPDPAFGNSIELTSAASYAGSTTAGSFCGTKSQYKLYVAGRFNKPYKDSILWSDGSIMPSAKSAQGKHTGAWLDFGNRHEILLKVGISFVSQEGALTNLNQEIPGWNFDDVHSKARRAWTTLLNRVKVEGGTPDQRKIFATGLYHSFLSPNLFSDGDGSYSGFDNQVHLLAGSKQAAQYANFSDWDIYRNTVQLQALFKPLQASDMMQSLVNDAVQSGWYPRWPAANDVTYVMGGDSAAPVIASSYAFGAHNFDTATALQYMVKAATQPGVGPHNSSERPFLEDYRKLGYVPSEKDRTSASRTLEYANDDFAIAQFAKSLGNTSAYQTLLKQSENWKSLFDPETHWIRPRLGDGAWLSGFDAERSMPKGNGSDQLGFEEGNTYQYTFMIPFDYPALFKAIGGDDQVTPRLDKFFLKLRCWGDPCFNMENEPDFVTPYAYVFAGQPWKTQEVVTRIAKETFKATPDGIPGNDDLGATSGVYVWNALGFYPAIPGVGGLVLGTPMFEKATLHLAGKRIVVISRRGAGFFVQKVTLDGMEYPNSWLPLEKLHPGTTRIEFTTGDTPNKELGRDLENRPPSFR
jgi:predicted alpha-1,2-mannosidase